MSSIAERIKARLQEQKSQKSKRGGSDAFRSNKSISSDGVTSRSSLPYPRLSLYGTGYEDNVANLKLAVALNIYGRRYCYPNYMETGFAVLDSLVSVEDTARFFKHYCLEPMPDVCYCGRQFFSNEGTLRPHCAECRGNIDKHKIDGYTVQRLATHIGAHESWIEYAAAWALVGFRAQPSP